MGNFQRSDNKRIGFSGPRGGDRGGSRGGFGGRGGSRGGFGGDRGGRGGFGGDRERRPVTMHPAVCDECKKECEVPFMPTEGKPVLCKECFGGGRSDSPRPSFGGDRGSRGSFGGGDRGGERREYSDRRPSFSSRGSEDRNSGNDDLKKQLADVNTKLEKLIKIVSDMVEKKEKFKPEAKKETLKSVVRKALKK